MQNEIPELLQLAVELHNHKVISEMHRKFRDGNMKAFYATAEMVMRVQCGNPVVRSVIKEDQLISDRDQVDAAIAEYFQAVYGSGEPQSETEGDIAMWTSLESAVEAT